MFRFADHRGADVQLNTGELRAPARRAPRTSFKTAGCTWRTVIQHHWKHHDHINILEVRAWLAYARLAARRGRKQGRRWAHILDSMVALSVLAKGRSSSRHLNAIVRRGNAVLLGTGLMPFYLWTASADNPADRPSRA